MKGMTYKRNNDGNMFIDIDSDTQPRMTSRCSVSNYAKAGLALIGTVGTVAWIKNTVSLPSFGWSSDKATSDNKILNNQHSLINPQEAITFADKSFPALPRHAKRAFGSEFQINTYITATQRNPSVAALTTGDFVVVWESKGQDGDGYGIYGQRFSSTGVPQSSEFQANTYTASYQWYHSVAALSTDDFVVVWESLAQDGDSSGIYGQRFSNAGVPQGGEFQINTYTTGSQSFPSAAALNTGDFVVVWESNGQDGSIDGIYGQRFSSTGVPQGSEFQINTYTTSLQSSPSIAVLSTGDFLVVWESSGQDGDSWGIYGQRFSNTGTPQGTEFQINTYTTGSQRSPSIAALLTDGFVVVWESYNQSCNGCWGIYGQRFSSTGITQGSEFQVNTFQINNYTTSWQGPPSVAALNSGDFVVVWESDEQSDIWMDIHGQRFSNAGIPQGGEFQINNYTTSNQWYPFVAALSTGDFLVAWTSSLQDGDNDGIYGRIYFKPVLRDNGLTVNEGEIVVLSNLDLSTRNTGNNDSDLIFTVSNIQHGQFERVSNAGVAITNFIQQDIIDGSIQFTHDGSENPPTYDVSVSDSVLTDGPVSANITFSNNVNDGPVLENNGLLISKGAMVILNALDLSATDPDNTAIELTFMLNNVKHGQFERTSNAGIVITSFTQQEVIDSGIQFVHDGTEILPEYSLNVTDGALTSASEIATIVFIVQNQLVTKPGETIILGPKQLVIQSQLDPMTLEISISNLQHGLFEKNVNQAVSIFSFTLSELNSGVIQFVHSGTENIPQFTLHLKDVAQNYTFAKTVIGNAILNHAPFILNPTGTLNWPLNTLSTYQFPNVLFSDPDRQQLQLSVRKLNGNSLPEWLQFDNSTNILTGTPTISGVYNFKINARDPYDGIAEDRFSIDTKVNNGSFNPVPFILAIAGGAGLLASAIAGGIVYFKKTQDRETRQQHEFARKIRHHLCLQKVDNFKSEKGQQFVQSVRSLSDLLREEQGIDITTMDDKRLDELARNIATAAKNKISPATVGLWKKSAITIQEFADNIEQIARDNRLDDISYAEVSDDVGMPMHTM